MGTKPSVSPATCSVGTASGGWTEARASSCSRTEASRGKKPATRIAQRTGGGESGVGAARRRKRAARVAPCGGCNGRGRVTDEQCRQSSVGGARAQ
eukprot:scaffold4934_cov128-Isochrysis_galbana.AAC.2